MKLNTNISSLKVLNNMGKNDTRLEKSLERLSSGKRINKAADDATGLAISRKMQVQIDALSKATENANDGISLIQTAEGALNEVHSILQRMRELSVQSANGSLSDEDRMSAQSEIDMLSQEVDRIANSIQFNSMNLLDGSINCKTYSSDKKIADVIMTADGVNPGTYKFNITNAATKTSKISEEPNKNLVDENGMIQTTGTIYINGVEVEFSRDMTEADALEALRDAAELSNVTFTTTTGSLVTMSSDGTENLSRLIFENQIPGESDLKITGSATILSLLGLSTDNSTQAVDRYEVGAAQLATDITGSLGETIRINGMDIKITEEEKTFEDLLNKIQETGVSGIAVQKNTTGGYNFDTAFLHLVEEGTTTLKDLFDATLSSSTKTTNTSGTDLLNGTIGRNCSCEISSWDDPTSGKVIGFPAGSTAITDENKVTFTGPNGFELLIENNGQVGECELIITSSGALDLQIGANEGQSMTIKIPNMSAKAIGLENINIRTREKAEEAISAIDDAIARVSEVRSKLGAFQNRLDYTINSLTDAEQNLTESLSRIQDTDMAEEMSTYTQANILSEAGISILAQANQRPQGLLQLLQNMI